MTIERSLRRLHRIVESRRHELRAVFWETTLRCNLSCIHCGSECSHDDNMAAGAAVGAAADMAAGAADLLNRELDTGEIIKAVQDIAQDFDPRRIMFYITGGEPLVRKDLFEVTGAMSSAGFKWGMVTNGTLVDSEAVENCRRTGMSTVSISIDGMKKEHDSIRGSGTFEKAVRAVRLFKDAGFLEAADITTCINKFNIGSLELMHSFFSDLDFGYWRIIATAPIGRAAQSEGLLPDREDHLHILDFIRRKRSEDSRYKVTYSDEGYLGERYECAVRDRYYSCEAGISIASILHNGDIFACPSIPRKLIQGNIRTDRFSDVWEHKFTEFRDRRWMKQGNCSGCKYFQDCRGNSMHLWDFEKGGTKYCYMDQI